MSDRIKSEICEVMREAYKRNWITTRDGNCAVKDKDSGLIYITASGVDKGKITEKDILIYVMRTNLFVSHDNRKPSGEWIMHHKILEKVESDCATLHLHPPNIVAAMFAGWELSELSSNFPEVYRFTKVGHNVASWPAVSLELANHTYKNFNFEDNKPSIDIVGQKNHGSTSFGKDLITAFEHVERLEHICQVAMLSGVPPNK